MSVRVTVGWCLVTLLLVIALIVWIALGMRPEYGAESLLVVRPLDNAILGRSFERDIVRSNPGIVRLGVQVSLWTENTLKGTTQHTNGVVRLIAAGVTAAEAERIANQAAEGVCQTLQKDYRASTRILSPAHSIPPASIHESSKFRLGGSSQPGFPAAGRVPFHDAGISIDPGVDWKRYFTVWSEAKCDTQLMGQGNYAGAVLRGWLLGPTATNEASGVQEIRSQIDHEQGLIESSRKEQPFVSGSGLHGTHLSFLKQYATANAARSGPALISHKIHYYVIMNARGRCAVLMYSTVLAGESEQIQRMIQSTLRADSP